MIASCLICPDTAAPIQCAEVRFRLEGIGFSLVLHPTGGPHAVDLLIVVKRVLFLKGRGDDHGIHGRLFQRDVTGEGLSLPEVFKIAQDAAAERMRLTEEKRK